MLLSSQATIHDFATEVVVEQAYMNTEEAAIEVKVCFVLCSCDCVRDIVSLAVRTAFSFVMTVLVPEFTLVGF